MPKSTVTAPDGRTFTVNHPDGATQEQIFRYAKAQFDQMPAEPGPQPAPQGENTYWGDVKDNVYPSAMGVAQDAINMFANPVQSIQGMGQLAIGAGQKAYDMIPEPIRQYHPLMRAGVPALLEATETDYRSQAEAAGEFYADRYGGVENVKETFREDPVGVLADVTGLTGFGGRNPLMSAAGEGAKSMARGVMKGAMKYPTGRAGPSPQQRTAMADLQLRESLRPTTGGMKRLEDAIDTQSAVVNDLIAQANNAGGTVPIGEVLKRLTQMREQKGSSLVSGGADIKVINKVIREYMENARRLGKRELTATDLQELKRQVYRDVDYTDVSKPKQATRVEAQKEVARGAKEAVEEMVPSVKGENQTLGEYLELRPHMEAANKRITNREAIGLGDLQGATLGVGAGFFNPVLGAALYGTNFLLSNPRISPYTAGGIYRTGQGLKSAPGQQGLSSLYFGEQAGALEEEE